jgi:hypothetical protein
MIVPAIDLGTQEPHNNHMHRSGRQVRLLKSTSLAAAR